MIWHFNMKVLCVNEEITHVIWMHTHPSTQQLPQVFERRIAIDLYRHLDSREDKSLQLYGDVPLNGLFAYPRGCNIHRAAISSELAMVV